MLVYLSNAENVKGAPNQNFARELMELFTLGVGNYTEADVEASARAWTGYNADWPNYQYQFYPNRHDNGMKTFFGTTQAWTGPQIIDEILLNNPTKKQIAARYITKKLWEFLAAPEPAHGRARCHRPGVRGRHGSGQPGAADPQPPRVLQHDRQAGSGAHADRVHRRPLLLHAASPPTSSACRWRAESAGQQIYQPPNVSGWRPNAYWLNTSALAARADLAQSVTWRLRDTGGAFEDVNVIYNKTVAGCGRLRRGLLRHQPAVHDNSQRAHRCSPSRAQRDDLEELVGADQLADDDHARSRNAHGLRR